MASSKAYLFASLALAILFLSHGAARAAECPSESDPNIIYYNIRNTTRGSIFQQNLSNVYRRIINGATFREGSISYNFGVAPDRVYGFSSCHEFAFPGDCVQCLINIRSNFDRVAPLAVGARMCSKNGDQVCFMRYENYSF